MPNSGEEVLYDPESLPASNKKEGGAEVLYDPSAVSGPAQYGPKPMSAPKASDFLPDENTLPNFIEGVGSGAANLASGLYGIVRHPIDTLTNAAHTVGESYKLAKQGQYVPAVATAARLAGFDEPRLAELWNEGQGSRAIGEATPTAILDAYGLEKAAGRGNLEVNGEPVRDLVAKAARSPRAPLDTGMSASGKVTKAPLRPIVGAGSRVVGAGLGYSTGLPEGGLVGALTGKSIADALIPDRPFEVSPELYELGRNQMYTDLGGRLMRIPEPEPPEPELGTPENPGWMAKLPTRMPTRRPEIAAPEVTPEGEAPIGSGPTERYVQTLMQKPILTPEEQANVERILGPNARMRPGEGLAKWRSRVTGLFKAQRPRTE